MKAINKIVNFGSNDGFALVLTLLVMAVMIALISSAIVVGSNHKLTDRYYERTSVLTNVANSGLEFARAKINGDPTIYPDSGYATIENGATVTDGKKGLASLVYRHM